MKKLFLSACLLIITTFINAQLKGVLDRAKQKAENKAKEKANKKTDDKVDCAFTKTENLVTDPVKDTPDTPAEKTESPVKKDSVAPALASIKAYSEYDFVPGERVIGFEDFSTGSIGDFPAGWNTSASAEIVIVEGKPDVGSG